LDKEKNIVPIPRSHSGDKDIEMGKANRWEKYEWLHKTNSYDGAYVKEGKRWYDMFGRRPGRKEHDDLSFESEDELDLDSETFVQGDTRPVILTVQIPVYTEDFGETLVHTFENIKTFVNTWNQEHTDSKVNVLIHEDGLQKVNETEKNIRIDYYETLKDSFSSQFSVSHSSPTVPETFSEPTCDHFDPFHR
jgi:hypothetical protein